MRRHLIALLTVLILTCTAPAALAGPVRAEGAEQKTDRAVIDGVLYTIYEDFDIYSKLSVGELLNLNTSPELDAYVFRFIDASGKECTPAQKMATGQTMQVLEPGTGNVLEEATVILKGDVQGTGTMNIAQLTTLAQALTGKKPLDGAYRLAGDLNDSGTIDIADLSREAALLAPVLTPGQTQILVPFSWYTAGENDVVTVGGTSYPFDVADGKARPYSMNGSIKSYLDLSSDTDRDASDVIRITKGSRTLEFEYAIVDGLIEPRYYSFEPGEGLTVIKLRPSGTERQPGEAVMGTAIVQEQCIRAQADDTVRLQGQSYAYDVADGKARPYEIMDGVKTFLPITTEFERLHTDRILIDGQEYVYEPSGGMLVPQKWDPTPGNLTLTVIAIESVAD